MRASTAFLGWAFCTALADVFAGEPVSAQCSFDWRPGEPVGGVNGYVYAVTNWDPDGDGPQPELLVVGGLFSVAGGVKAKNIAAWDGNAWNSVGGGMIGYVRALTVYHGHLIAGGGFDSAGSVKASNIAEWDGSS